MQWVNGTVSLISLSYLLLLVYGNVRVFCVLTFYPSILPDSLMSSSSFLVASSWLYTIKFSVNSDTFTASFQIWIPFFLFFAVTCFCSVAQSCLTLHNPMDHSMAGLLVPQNLPEFIQVHVQCISDAIQPSHSLTHSSSLLSIFPSIRVFSNESSVCIR